MKKSSYKFIALGIVLFMVLIVALVLIGKATNGSFTDFQNASLRKVNEDNIYQTAEFNLDEDYENFIAGATGDNDYAVTINKDRVLTVNAATPENQDVVVEIGTVTLEADKAYLFDSSLGANGSKNGAHLQLVFGNDDFVDSANTAVKIAAGSEARVATIKLVLTKNMQYNNITLKPVICEGTNVAEVVPFYVNK